MKKRAAIFLEPWQKATTNRFVVTMDGLVRRLEIDAMVLLRAKRAARNYQASIYSTDMAAAALLASHGLNVVGLDERLSQEQTEAIVAASRRIARHWYEFDSTEEFRMFLGVDLGLALQEDIRFLVHGLLERVEQYKKVLDDTQPDVVYVENSHSPAGLVLDRLCRHRGIQCYPVFPMFYAFFKENTIKKWRYRRYNSQLLNPVDLYSLESSADRPDSGRSYRLLLDAPYISYLSVMAPVVENSFSGDGYSVFTLAKKADMLRHDMEFQRRTLKIDRADSLDMFDREKIRDCFSRLAERAQFLGLFDYADINLWSALEKDFRYLIQERGSALARNLLRFQDVVSITQPDILMVGDDRGPVFVRAEALFAQARGIPVVEVQHGVFPSVTPMSTPISDRICAWGALSKRSYELAGADSERIIVTGSPKYDSLRKKAKQRLPADRRGTPRTILFATEPQYRDLNCQAVAELGRLFEREQDVVLVVKPHPGESGWPYARSAQGFSERVVVGKGSESIEDFLIEADIVMVVSSTVGLEAAIADKEVVVLNVEGKPDAQWLLGMLPTEIKEMEELVPALEGLLHNVNEAPDAEVRQARQRFVYEHAYLQDGQASNRVAETILGMIERDDRGRGLRTEFSTQGKGDAHDIEQ